MAVSAGYGHWRLRMVFQRYRRHLFIRCGFANAGAIQTDVGIAPMPNKRCPESVGRIPTFPGFWNKHHISLNRTLPVTGYPVVPRV